MKAPDCISSVCKDYRDLFPSDHAMADSLGIDPDEVPPIVSGAALPTLDMMLVIQAVLRKHALVAAQRESWVRTSQD